MTWTTDSPTEPGWYWVKSDFDDSMIVCNIYHGVQSKGLMIENFDYEYDELPLLALSLEHHQFQSVKPPEE